MIELLAVAVLLYFGYLLFVRGWAWGILLALFSVFGGAVLIWFCIPASHGVALVVSGYQLSYAAVASIVITALGITFFECSTK